MTRGKRPVVAIGEAKRSAVAAGFILVDLITEAKLAFDFVVHRDRITSLVRVRRMKQAGFRVAIIMRTCAQPIAELQSCTLPDQLVRELWVRGPARAFHRYRVLPDTVEEIGVVVMQKTGKIPITPIQGRMDRAEIPYHTLPAIPKEPAGDRQQNILSGSGGHPLSPELPVHAIIPAGHAGREGEQDAPRCRTEQIPLPDLPTPTAFPMGRIPPKNPE